LTRVSVISHSIGAMISAVAYLQRPALFQKFVWLGATPCLCNHEDYIGGFEEAELDAIYEAVSLDFFGWLRVRPLWDLVVLILLLGGLAVTGTGVYLAVVRIKRDLTFKRPRKELVSPG